MSLTIRQLCSGIHLELNAPLYDPKLLQSPYIKDPIMVKSMSQYPDWVPAEVNLPSIKF